MSVRLAVRALILIDGRLLLVNAYPDGRSDLWCAPGGGAEPHLSLPENLVREVREETGLIVVPGRPALVNEFHDEATGFHQVDIYFRAEITSGVLDPNWTDPDGVVSRRRLVTAQELGQLRHKPGALAQIAWDPDAPTLYDPLEPMVG